jgi:2-oxo-4-hydroxy-4-carboxy-5-ureidoimidazoline decarboxylase
MSNAQGLERLNSLNEKMAWDELLHCCGASKWALKMMKARPFASAEALHQESEIAFVTLDEIDWLEAFSHHLKIETTLQALARGSDAYEKKFGFIFIICPGGKSAAELLETLNARLGNERSVELRNAAEQQKQITWLRLSQLLEP